MVVMLFGEVGRAERRGRRGGVSRVCVCEGESGGATKRAGKREGSGGSHLRDWETRFDRGDADRSPSEILEFGGRWRRRQRRLCCDTATSKQYKACARTRHVTRDITAEHHGRRRESPSQAPWLYTRAHQYLDRCVWNTNNLYTPFIRLSSRHLHCRL